MYISVSTTPSMVKQVGGLAPGLPSGKDQTIGLFSAQKATHFDLDDSQRVHSWLRANLAAFGRSVTGPGFTLTLDPEYGDEATQEEKELLYNFYHGVDGRDFKNISDWYPADSKFYKTAGQYRLFGQAAWELRKNGFDEVVSYDIIPGFIYPNLNGDGTFRDPPFYQFLINSAKKHALELSPDDIVLFMQPDFGTRLFSTDFEALTEYILPTDLYLNLAMRSVLENYRTPMGVYSLDEHATQIDVDNFSSKLDTLYKGPSKYGSSAVVVRGKSEFKGFSADLKDLPFRDGHSTMQDEIEGISGVSGAKLGRTNEVNRSNMREIRRDYWETTLQPISNSLTNQLYLLVHQRIFGIRSWRLTFNAPDFLTRVENATVGMRGRQWGAFNTNELRSIGFGLGPIEEEWANSDYLLPSNVGIAGGSTANDTDTNENPNTDEEPVDEPNTDSDPPIRGDTEDSGKRATIAEMKSYSRFCINRLDKPHRRKFNFRATPDELVFLVEEALAESGKTRDGINEIFDAVITGLED